MTKKAITTVMVLLFVWALVPAMASAQSCLCMYAGATYKICYEAMDDSYDITGYRIASVEDVPIAGSAMVNRNGDIIIGFSQLPLWNASSTWVHPHATNNINYTQGTYTASYHGNSEAATLNYEGPAYVVSCPSAAEVALSPEPEEGAK